MNRFLSAVTVITIATMALVVAVGCGNEKKAQTESAAVSCVTGKAIYNADSVSNRFVEFVPDGYHIFQEIHGDLNKDGVDDVVLLIEERRGEGERRYCDEDDDFVCRGGIIIAFNKGGRYEVVFDDHKCISYGEMEIGPHGPPHIEAAIQKGVLVINMGRFYGTSYHESNSYKFRYQNSDFELIGYDEKSTRMVGDCWPIYADKSVNFLSKKMLTKKDTTLTVVDEEECKQVLEEKWEAFTVREPIRLREIAEFSEFNMDKYITIINRE